MRIFQHLFFYFLLTTTNLWVDIEGLKYNLENSIGLTRSDFPKDFMFGAASSAYQIEGSANTNGRKPSIWDTFTKQNSIKILDHSSGDVAEDFYHRYKEDITLMKEIGFNSFRFSISWSRILPNGRVGGGVNKEGVKFYNSLIDQLLSQGIEPFVTLFHWDLPQNLEDEYGGFLSSKIVDDYRDYAEFCFQNFGDRVKYWVTLNEPNYFSCYGYATGDGAPGRCSDYIGNCSTGNSATEPYLVIHHMILCHATAVQLYRQRYQASQNGKIGIVVTTFWKVPKFNTSANRKAASRALDFTIGWTMQPLTYGEYPKSMRRMLGNRLPRFTKEESKLIKGSLEFVGINYYTARYVQHSTHSSFTSNLSYTSDPHVTESVDKNGIPIGEECGSSWLYIYPQGLEELLLHVKRKYQNPPIFITENGMDDISSMPMNNSLIDNTRIKYHYLHLSSLFHAIKKGVDVRGYYIWSFMDDFEWKVGYTVRFGITYIDFENGLTRILKASAFWFKNFLQHPNVTIPFSFVSSE
ncbi:beta glucosidase 17 [Euphorbia peplus]|nr:beta glucosidase 17 [Euphorbia peplus]